MNEKIFDRWITILLIGSVLFIPIAFITVLPGVYLGICYMLYKQIFSKRVRIVIVVFGFLLIIFFLLFTPSISISNGVSDFDLTYNFAKRYDND
jgi:hypothetical protein